MQEKFLLQTTAKNAAKLAAWIEHRGGVAVWPSVDLSDPDKQLLTPALTDGEPTARPHWKCATEAKLVTTTDQVGIYQESTFREFTVAIRRSDNGLSAKLTDASQAKVERVIAQCKDKHGNAFIKRGVLDVDRPSIGVYYASDPVSLTDFIAAQQEPQNEPA